MKTPLLLILSLVLLSGCVVLPASKHGQTCMWTQTRHTQVYTCQSW